MREELVRREGSETPSLRAITDSVSALSGTASRPGKVIAGADWSVDAIWIMTLDALPRLTMNCSSGVNDDSVSGRDECVELARENPTFFVVVEVLQELEQLVLVAPEDGFDLWWLLWVRDKHLQVKLYQLPDYAFTMT